MHKRNSIVKYSLIILTAILLVATMFIIGLNKGYSFELKDELKDTYSLNESIYIPHGSFDVSGKSIDAEYQIYYPNGNSYSKSYCTLDVAGKYTIKYFVNVDGKMLTEEKSFIVINSLYAVSGTGSAVYSEESGGLEVDLPSGGVFKYNKLINLSDYTSEDSIISLYVKAPGVQVRDFETLYVTLTDAYNSENQIHFRAYAADNFPSHGYSKTLSYFSCAIGGKNYFVGLSHDSGNISKGDRYGYWSQFSFSNQGQKGIGLDDQASFGLDYGKKDFYVKTSFAGKSKVAELSNPAYFSNPWEGFTNGLCYLSVSADNYINASAKIVITEIAGDKLTETELNDTEKPEIVLDYGGFSEIPFAIKDMPYKLFDATVIDNVDVNCELNVNVFFDYYTSKRENVNVSNGKFIPKRLGIYTVIYSSQDSYGNYQEEIVQVEVKDKEDVNPLKISVAQTFGTVNAGESICVNNSFTVNSSCEQLGDIKVKIYLKNDEEKVLLFDGKVEDSFNVEQKLFNLGNNEIIYEFSDYIRTVTIQKDFNVLKPSCNQFLQTAEQVGLPEYLIRNNDYILPDVNLVSYDANGKKEIKTAELYVFENGKDRLIENNKYTVNSNENSVKIKYVDPANGDNFIEKQIEVISLYEGEQLLLNKMFVSENATVLAEKDWISITTEEDSVVDCVQELLADKFSFTFDVDPEKNAFDEVLIKLSDSRVKGCEILVSFIKSNGGSKVYINKEYDGASYTVSADFNKSKNVDYELTFSGNNNVLSFEGSAIQIKKYLNGEEFNGFPSGTVVMSVELKNATGLSSVRLKKLNGQPLTNVSKDSISPSMAILSQDKLSYKIGDKYQTPVAIAYDVVCGLSSATISVRKIGGTYLTNDDGVLIKNLVASESYTLTLSEYGEYSIQISTADKNNKFNQNIVISVLDRVAPEITLDKELKEDYKAGAEIVLPTMTVTDNLSTEIEAFIIIVTPRNKYETVTDNKYKFNEIGEYKIRFVAYDEVGNMCLIEKVVKVG